MKKRSLLKWPLLVLVAILFVLGTLWVTGEGGGGAAPVLYKDWMAFVSDDCLLTDITIPGTHDSGARANGETKRQSMSIAWQVQRGVRFLDISLSTEGKDGLALCYDGVKQRADLDTILDKLYAFLNRHNRETILIYLSADDPDADSIADAVAQRINASPDRWYTGTTVPTVGEVRGKLVLLRGYEGSDIGIDCVTGWPLTGSALCGSTAAPLYVTAWGSSRQTAMLWNVTASALDNASAAKGTLSITFAGGLLQEDDHPSRQGSCRSMADEINERLTDYIAANNQAALGVIAVDFVTAQLIADMADMVILNG